MWALEMEMLLNADEEHFELQWDSWLSWQKNDDKKWAPGMNSATCNHCLHFSLMAPVSVNPAGLLQQPSECKQSTLPRISSSTVVCLSIAHCLLRCNSRMSQLPAPASFPLLGGSAECFNCPGLVAGWHYSMHGQQPTTQHSARGKDFTINMLVDNKKKGTPWAPFSDYTRPNCHLKVTNNISNRKLTYRQNYWSWYFKEFVSPLMLHFTIKRVQKLEFKLHYIPNVYGAVFFLLGCCLLS